MAGTRGFFLIAALCSLAPISRAETPSDDQILGTWFRVYEKCNTPLERLPDFEAGGGDALVGRRMILQLEKDRYVATGMDSLRCGKNPEDFDRPPETSKSVDCFGRTENSGLFSRDEERFHFAALETIKDNNWGTTFRAYFYQLRGSVLELSPDAFTTSNCGTGNHLFLYFIRYPAS